VSHIGQSADAGFHILSLIETEPGALRQPEGHLKELDKDGLPGLNGRALIAKRTPEESRHYVHRTRRHYQT